MYLMQITDAAGNDATGMLFALVGMGILGNIIWWGLVLFLIRGLIRFLKN